VRRLAAALPDGGPLINLCERRDRFLIAYCAALVRGRTTLLPPSRAPLVVDEVAAQYSDSHRCDDEWVDRALAGVPSAEPTAEPAVEPVPRIALGGIAEIAFTSGSTGAPKAHVKRWGTLLGSTAFNGARVRESLAPRYGAARPWIVATVPPQHMYGTETSILLPLAADMAVHAARPLFPADVAAALDEVPAPRVLVTTPVHLRALADSGQQFPEVGAIVSATAPLDRALAAAAEQAFGGVLLEMFGSTETCVIATRRTAREDAWHLYPGVSVQPSHDGAAVDAPWFAGPATLQDIVELVESDRFVVRSRGADMIEVAGKRASLADLTRRLLGIAGVRDAVVFQADTGIVRRVAAFVVAPELGADGILAALGRGIDPAFLPRPLVLVPALPRNEVGKLTREALERLAAEHLHPAQGQAARAADQRP
ncbi:MAG: AMP-binding protein, partial [Steroidobacteraceae bacterium]